ncbi:MAG TPA: competence/damage-inducible protein A [Solirubrobacteraceae bacterium]
MSVRAGIVVTGTEVLSGIIRDANGPWLAERLRGLGVSLAHVMVVGDRPDDVRASLDFLAGARMDLIITTGGLGPTADDLTADVVAGFAGRSMAVDPALEERIWQIVSRMRGRWRDASEEGMRAGTRKQALVPGGAVVLEPVGTAPGLVVSGDGVPPVVVLPGPPGELQPMWADAVETPPVRSLLARVDALEQRIVRMIGIPESELARTLRGLDGLERLEITTCLRRGELEVATVFPASAAADYDAFEAALLERHGTTVFSRDGSTIDEIVAALLLGPPVRTIAVAESCTGGLMAGRLTDRAGSSAYVLGGAVVYSNEAKTDLAGVPPELIARVGAVSPEVALALADGAAERFSAAVGVGITGIAGPGGGTPEKPVGMVCVCVAAGESRLERTLQLPGDRAMIRDRTTTAVMHLLRRLLS